jgi:quercetin dioxygenase-like cupin family protein
MPHRIVTAEDAQKFIVIGDNQTIRLTGADTNGAYTLIEQCNVAGIGVPPHVHANEDETFHIAEGQVTFTVDGQEIVADAGTTVFVPRGVPHSFMTTGEGTNRVFLIISPPGLEAMFQEMHQLPAGPPDMAVISGICERYGISFA